MATKAKPSNARARLRDEIGKWLKPRKGLQFTINHDEGNTRRIEVIFTLCDESRHDSTLTDGQVEEIRVFLNALKREFNLIVHRFVMLDTNKGVQLSCTLA